jgi:hypothetical protein
VRKNAANYRNVWRNLLKTWLGHEGEDVAAAQDEVNYRFTDGIEEEYLDESQEVIEGRFPCHQCHRIKEGVWSYDYHNNTAD